MKKWALFFLFLLGLDIISKMGVIEWVAPMHSWDRLYPFGGVPLFSHLLGISFSLNYVINTGAAWGLFAGHSGFLFGLRTVIILGFVSYLLFQKKGELPKFPAWLIVTGAVGNAIDYVLYGHVIDFFHFNFWGYSFPVFNLADSYITLGVAGLLWKSSTSKTSQPV